MLSARVPGHREAALVGEHRRLHAVRRPNFISTRAYDLEPAALGSEVRVSVCVRPNRGLTGRLMAEAANALLAAGALQAAISRLALEAASVC